jgi:hypothetical protein
MKRPSAYLGISLVAALALGCQERPQGFMPLETGRTTVYDVEYSNVIGRVQKAEAVVRIEEKKKIGEHEYFRVVGEIKGIAGHEPDVYYQRFAADGLHELRFVGGRPVDYLQTPWPLEVGRAWLVNAAGFETTCRVDARGPAILPEKTYDDAYKISCYGARTGSRFKNETYLVDGVGAVRTIEELGDLTIEMRLREAG